MINKIEEIKKEVKPHLQDILNECEVEKESDGYFNTDLKQIIHNVFEIGHHLGMTDEEITN